MKNAAHTVADLSPEPTGEHATMCPQENETEVKRAELKCMVTNSEALLLTPLMETVCFSTNA